MKIPALVSFAGFVLLVMATFCPILKAVLCELTGMCIDGNLPYGVVILLVAAGGHIRYRIQPGKYYTFGSMAFIRAGGAILFAHPFKNIYLVWVHHHKYQWG